MSIHIHEENGVPVSVTIPYESYREFLELQEELDDIADAVTIRSRIEDGIEEIFPFELRKRISGGESAIKVFREYRGFTQQQLSDKSGVSRALIAKVETGMKKGSVDTLKKLAFALDLDLDNIA